MGLNAYSGMLTIVTGIDSLRPVNPTRRIRIAVIVVLAVVWLLLGNALDNASSALANSLLAMLYPLAPWTAVNLMDFFFVRRGHYAITDLFTPNGIYGSWAWRGIVAFLIGIAVEIPFMVVGTTYVGFIANDYLQLVDISWIVGMVVAGGSYYLFTRSLDLPAEQVRNQGEREGAARHRRCPMTSEAEPAAAAVALGEVAAAADALVASFAAHDREAYFASVTPDATFVFHTSTQRFASRADYEREWASWEADGFHVDSCESTDRRIDLITLEVAVMTHRVRTRIAGVEETQLERETIVFRRTQEGSWLAVHEHLSPDPERVR